MFHESGEVTDVRNGTADAQDLVATGGTQGAVGGLGIVMWAPHKILTCFPAQFWVRISIQRHRPPRERKDCYFGRDCGDLQKS